MSFREDMNNRFFKWINSILDKIEPLFSSLSSREIARQITKSSTSSGSNYRVSGRAKSIKDMINKLKISEEEIEETLGWLELIEYRWSIDFKWETQEGHELMSIVVKSINSLRKKL